ncbi:hypothetical protein F5Y16DRAFT_409450 [Xylariaceae sp. FL0255]|nr:hypothetical protein F5Y16DRAFT_409450 [Xylariaceae sp. FL0255]
MEKRFDLVSPLLDKVKATPFTFANTEPALDHNWGKPIDDWRSEAVAVGDPSREYEYVQGYGGYRIPGSDPEVYSAKRISDHWTLSRGYMFTLHEEDEKNGGPDGKNMVYLPMHKSCLQVALRAPSFNRGNSSATQLRILFRVLRHRSQAELESEVKTRRYRDGFATQIHFSGFQGEWREERHLDYTLMEDPFHIPKLTEITLKNLKPRRVIKTTPVVSSFRKCFARLPFELKLLILVQIFEARDLPLSSTGWLGPRFWKAMFDKHLPPMKGLWDLDFKLIRQTDPHLEMDWELLFRMLSHKNKFPYWYDDETSEFPFNHQYIYKYIAFSNVMDHTLSGLDARRRL